MQTFTCINDFFIKLFIVLNLQLKKQIYFNSNVISLKVICTFYKLSAIITFLIYVKITKGLIIRDKSKIIN
jgi:hypothetical protein